MAKKYDDEDDDDMPSVRKNEPLTGMNGLFANTNIVILVIFAFCCNSLCLLPLILSIIGVVTCTDQKAKSNATICLIISGIATALQVIGGWVNQMSNPGGFGGFK
jgi:hypothetical protein